MRILLPFILINLSCLPALAQGTFPAKWMGEYQGTMTLGYTDRQSASVEVSLTIAEVIPDSVWTHKMVFRSEQYGLITKDYLIKAVSKGDSVNYVLDEQNGIAMEMSFMEDCFYGMYTVLGNTYITTLRRIGDKLLWDLFAAPTSSLTITEHNGGKSEVPIKVESLKVNLHQTVLLEKVK